MIFSSAILKKGSRGTYEPFSNFKKDLRLLLTFKSMISKIVQELCKKYPINLLSLTILLEMNMINDAVLLAILFVMDDSERQIEVPRIFN